MYQGVRISQAGFVVERNFKVGRMEGRWQKLVAVSENGRVMTVTVG